MTSAIRPPSPSRNEIAAGSAPVMRRTVSSMASRSVAVSFRDGEGGRIALVTIKLPGDQPLPSAHRHAGAIEEAVRERCPSLGDVIVHTEPAEAEASKAD